ncbi:ComEC family competence protein [Arenibacter sp. BSSL-BM3]|uniref:ComEC family competence protein n=1 Tax=Arenibacter arenosicollis TaxID=2762274 RepID=A0ABR7QGU5_9FLAO|nr:ComEC/Rec2 family competence protein [Arenibacter arenosicollis]MBC8766411.1 ComEC family competence protein [Arenibacter arenosicollis]
MRLLRFTTIKLTLFLICGILIGYFFNPSLALSFSLTIILLIALGGVFAYNNKAPSMLFGLLTGLLTVAIGIFSLTLSKPNNIGSHYTHHSVDGKRAYTLKIREVLKSNDFSDRYVAHVKHMDSLRVSGKVLLNIAIDSTKGTLLVDDEIVVFTTLQPITPPLNPYQFNYRKYLENIGIEHQVRIAQDNYMVHPLPDKTIFGLASNIRNHIIEKLSKENFGTEELGVIQALLLGQRNEITTEIDADYKNAGAYHILALSGLHIGILLGLLHFLLMPLELLPKGKTIKLVVIVLLLWSFALLAGLSASILRAVTMFSFVAYALYLNRPTSNFNILALSLFFILLLLDPKLLFQVGFQLSYAAVFSIVWIFPLLQKLWVPQYWFLRKTWELVSVSIAAQLGVLPISLYYFHQFPGLFLVSSLLILPFLTFILGFGILVITLSLANSLPSILVTVYDTVIRWMNTIIGTLARQENFLFRNISFDAIQLILCYGIIISMVMAFTKVSYKRVMVFLVLILCFQSYILGNRQLTKQKETLVVGHITRNTTLIHQTGQNVTVFTNNPTASERMANDYTIAQNITKVEHQPIKNSFLIGEDRLLILDSSFVQLPKEIAVSTLLLTQSPKINLERLLDSVQPVIVIADGSNYRSYIERWKATCNKKKLPFHSTGEKGALIYNLR